MNEQSRRRSGVTCTPRSWKGWQIQLKGHRVLLIEARLYVAQASLKFIRLPRMTLNSASAASWNLRCTLQLLIWYTTFIKGVT